MTEEINIMPCMNYLNNKTLTYQTINCNFVSAHSLELKVEKLYMFLKYIKAEESKLFPFPFLST